MIRPTGPPRGRAFQAGEGTPILVRERLGVFQRAFLADPRPGLVFEYGRLAFANEAAKRLLRSSPAANAFLEALKAAMAAGTPPSGLCLQTDAGKFLPEPHPARSRAVHAARICFLIKQPTVSPAFGSLTERELGVLTWLVKGLTNAQIGMRLGISIETVRKHVSHSLKKTGTTTRTGLVGRALRG